MNILLFSTYATNGGAARACYRLHKGLRHEGHSSSLLVRQHDGAALDGVLVYDECNPRSRLRHEKALARLRSTGLAHPGSNYFSPAAPHALGAFDQVLGRADVVNLHWTADYLSTRDLRRIFGSGKPAVWTLHDARCFTGGCHYPDNCSKFRAECADCPQLLPKFRALASLGLDAQRNLFQASTVPTFVAPSRWLAGLAASSLCLDNARIEVIPYGLDLDIFKPASDQLSNTRTLWKRDACVVLFGAHSLRDKRKGVDLIIDAIRHCVQEPDIRREVDENNIVFACFGHNLDLERAERLPVINLGSFTNDTEAALIYQSADIFVCASREDNLPNTVLEAMGCGLAVVGTNVGGIPEMVEADKTGKLVPSGDPQALSAALLSLMRSRNLIREMGRNGRAKCERAYSLSGQVSAYVELFDSLRGNKTCQISRYNIQRALRNTISDYRASRYLAALTRPKRSFSSICAGLVDRLKRVVKVFAR